MWADATGLLVEKFDVEAVLSRFLVRAMACKRMQTCASVCNSVQEGKGSGRLAGECSGRQRQWQAKAVAGKGNGVCLEHVLDVVAALGVVQLELHEIFHCKEDLALM